MVKSTEGINFLHISKLAVLSLFCSKMDDYFLTSAAARGDPSSNPRRGAFAFHIVLVPLGKTMIPNILPSAMSK